MRHVWRLGALGVLGLLLLLAFYRHERVSAIPGAPIAILPLDLPQAGEEASAMRVSGLWEIDSEDPAIGGYSALLVLGGQLRAFSDHGHRITFARPNRSLENAPTHDNVWDRGPLRRFAPDIEAATRDPATGDYWLAFEERHALIRFDIASAYVASREPPEWREWPHNSGAEAIARFGDGRFVVLPETLLTGFLYPADPTSERIEPRAFAFTLPDDYHPTDMAQLPDGRLLVLLRKLAPGWPFFSGALGIADIATLDEADSLEVRLLTRLDSMLPRENWEALGVDPADAEGSGLAIWVMSDDNFSPIQRTLLARLEWTPTREKGAGP